MERCRLSQQVLAIEVYEMRLLKQLDPFRVVKIRGVLPPMDLGRKDPISGSSIQARCDIGPARFAVRSQSAAAGKRVDAEALPDEAYVPGVEILVWKADAVVDHGTAQQPASSPPPGADKDLGANRARRPIEVDPENETVG